MPEGRVAFVALLARAREHPWHSPTTNGSARGVRSNRISFCLMKSVGLLEVGTPTDLEPTPQTATASLA